jgi:CheY-like chemotaxis protein
MVRRFMNEPEKKQPLPESKSAPLIFVVDDYAELGHMIEVFLRRAGYQARVFSDPLVALTALETTEPKPRLLISDYRMPGINGLELIHRCKLVHPTLKVIAASANILEEEIEKYPFRPDRILPKPYSTEGLLSMVKSLLPD